MRKFTEEEIKALQVVKGIFSEKAFRTDDSGSEQAVGQALDTSCQLIDELLGKQKDCDLKDKVGKTLLSLDFTNKCVEIQRLYDPLSNKLAEYGMQLAVDMRGDYALVIIPDGLFFGNGNGKDYARGIGSDFLLDNSIVLDSSKNDLVTLLDGTEKILSYDKK